MEENTKRFLGVLFYPLSAGLTAAMNLVDQTALPGAFASWLGSLNFFGYDLSVLQSIYQALSGNEMFFTVHSFCLGLVFVCLFFGDLDFFYIAILALANAIPSILAWTDVITSAAIAKLDPYINLLYSNPDVAFLFILIPIPLSLAMAFGGFNMFTPFVWWHTRSEKRKRHIRKYPEMYWDVKTLEEGIGEVHNKALHKAGVKTVDDMLKANINGLSNKTGIDAKILWHWRDAAELLSLEDIDAIQAEILTRAKINGIYELSIKRPGVIYSKYNKIAKRLGIEKITKDRARNWKKIAIAIRKGKYKPESAPLEIETMKCPNCGNDVDLKSVKKKSHLKCPNCKTEIKK